jgi:hypothetical protein
VNCAQVEGARSRDSVDRPRPSAVGGMRNGTASTTDPHDRWGHDAQPAKLGSRSARDVRPLRREQGWKDGQKENGAQRVGQEERRRGRG